MKLSELIGSDNNSVIELSEDTKDLQVLGLSYDSRTTTTGDMFFCLKGESHDGHDFAASAVKKGARILVVDRELDLDTPQIVVDDTRATMGDYAETFYHSPSNELITVGVTGTNGKTTTINLLSEIAKAAGEKPETIGTLTGSLTTPEAPDLQRKIRELVGQGTSFLAMEVSSHALSQNRISNMLFDITIFTNLSLDHLDYHGSMESYYRAKSKLFTANHSKLAILNNQNSYGRRLSREIPIPKLDFSLEDIEILDQGLRNSSWLWEGEIIDLNLAGKFNIENALGAAIAANALGFSKQAIKTGLSKINGIPGRFESIAKKDNQPDVIVDYSHTPDGLQKVLTTIKELSNEAIVHVLFGCGGDRDKSKRSEMGRISEEYSSHIYLTSDNPRSENQMNIINDILAGIRDKSSVYVNPDRREAIHQAIKSANAEDVVLIAGKGCEAYQEVEGTFSSFQDIEVAKEALEARG